MYLIFTPLFYINGNPHIGHLYNIYLAKMFGRYLTTRGQNYLTLTGTDEHGDKVHKSYLDYIIKNNSKNFTIDDYRYMRRDNFKKIFDKLDSSIIYNTHTNMHIEYAKDIFQELKDKGVIYAGTYKGYYNLREERYIDEKEYASMDSDEKECFIETREEEGYYFKLEESVKAEIIKNIDNIVTSEDYKKYSINLVTEGKDIFISRKCNDVTIESKHSIYIEKENVCLYVWFDAILYYASVLRAYHHKLFKPIIVIGKDIQSFHISLLMHLSYHIFGYFPFKLVTHGMVNTDNVKVSKSYNNATKLNELEQKYDDLLYSYMLTKSIGSDMEISEEGVVQYANFLRNSVRNCYKRYFSLIETYKANVKNLFSLTNQITKHPDQIKLSEMYQKIYNLDEKLDGAVIYNTLIEAASYANQKITNSEFWDHSEEKEIDFFIVGHYVKFMILLESILCTPGIEGLFNILGESNNCGLVMAVKILSIKQQDIKNLNLDFFASSEYRKKVKEMERQHMERQKQQRQQQQQQRG